MHAIRTRRSRARLAIGLLAALLLAAAVALGTAAPALADVGTWPSNVGGVSSWLVAGGFSLLPGHAIQSARAKLIFQTDGNLVVYDENDQARWSSRTNGRGGTRADFQTDGNLVVYNGSTPLWASGTAGHPGSILAVQDDGNVVIYPHALWATGTNHLNPGNPQLSVLGAGGRHFNARNYMEAAAAQLIFQTDGNLVAYNEDGNPTWSSRTNGRGATNADFQTDGNLVVYNGSTPLWASGTAGHPGSILAVQDDGNVVIYPHALWATGTNHSSQDLQYAYGYVLAYPPQPGSKPVARMAERNFSAYFPFSGCGSVLSVGQVCTLGGDAPGGGPIRVAAVTPTSFTFVALPGHPEGANRLITFTFVTDSLTKRLYLTVWARGRWTAVAEATRDAGTANGFWQEYASNLAAGIARGDWRNF